MFSIVPLASKGRRQGCLTEADCQRLPLLSRSAESVKGQICNLWDAEKRLAESRKRTPRLWRVLWLTLWRPLTLGVSLMFLRGCGNAFVLPLLVKFIIEEFTVGNFDDVKFYLGCLLCERVLGALCEYHGGYNLTTQVPALFHASVGNLVMQKAATSGNRGTAKAGVNPTALFGRELTMAFNMMGFILRFGLMAIPSLFAGSITLLLLLGWPAVLGICWVVFTICIGTRLQHHAKAVEQKMSTIATARLATLTNVLSAIKAIKYFTWEEEFLEELLVARQRECETLKLKIRLSSTSGTLGKITPVTGSLITFVSFALLGNEMRPGDIFACNSVFMTMRFAVGASGALVQLFKTVELVIGRAQKLLLLEEGTAREVLVDGAGGGAAGGKETLVLAETEDLVVSYVTPGDVSSKDASAAGPEKSFTLASSGKICLASRGRLTAVCGAVGSGKSTLLLTLLGALEVESDNAGSVAGRARAVRSIGWCPQKAFTISGTIRENILLGRASDDDRLARCVADASLAGDLDLLPAGLEQAVGERGTTLSGGQQARLSLARALYGSPDLLVLDDPLAAVDAAVGRSLFRALRERVKTRPESLEQAPGALVVLNQLDLLPNFDEIVFISEGGIEAHGTFDELMRNPSFVKFMQSMNPKVLQLDTDEDRRQSEAELRRATDFVRGTAGKQATAAAAQALEQAAHGLVKWAVLRAYLFAPGRAFLFSTIFCFVFTYTTLGLRDWWLSVWSGDGGGQSAFHIGIFALFSSLHLLGSAVCVYIIGSFAEKAGKHLHSDCARILMRFPMSYFDETPSGRITSRFGSDLGMVDGQMPTQIDFTMTFGFTFLMMCTTVTANIPYVAVLFVAAVLLSMPVVKGLVVFVQDVKRHSNNAMAPILSNLTEAQRGCSLSTVLGCQEFFVQRHYKFTDNWVRLSSAALLNTPVAGTWCHFVHIVVLITVGFLSLHDAEALRESPGLIALYFSYAALWGLFADSTMGVVMGLITNLTSLERLLEYKLGDMPQEPAWHLAADPAAAAWPAGGSVHFKAVSMRYRAGLPRALDGLELMVASGEKLGIVGRTGAGKSSLTNILFRLVDCEEGACIIDGVNIAQLGLHTLRRAISMIPQEPIVMTGTVRYNLDPFNRQSEEALTKALERCGLAPGVGLDTSAGGAGASLSAGQLQLLTFGRTLLQPSRVVMMDEPTASVDMQTDRMVQQAVKEAFASRTVMIIAHRLGTVMDYCDRIAVMDAGKLAEIGTPQDLSKKAGGHLARLLEGSQRGSSAVEGAPEAEADKGGAAEANTIIEI
eukprot:TRINITY_DN21772_c0_g4_i1.p1 TRINITY_DN21772_c0_g4~~TRINITY_DN21772_c0_g4_i1.p1  ORF type:complete len:1292 (-),score=290.39 TRINITY_DN21772_c0_g4_i1:148-4023(-)